MKNLLLNTNMLPEGIEVYYNGMYGKVRFTCESYMTVCINPGPDKSRDVCVLVYPNQLDKLELVHGNHSHET